MTNQKLSKSEELFFVVDEHDQPLPSLPRRLVHGHGVWHRVAHVWVVNSKNQVLCQQRSLEKELNPGRWEAFFGGHIAPDESYVQAAVRELGEELDIQTSPQALKLWKVYKYSDPTGYNNEFQGVFVLQWNGKASDVSFDDGEVAQVKWVDWADAQTAIQQHGGTAWTFCGYELDLLHDLTTKAV